MDLYRLINNQRGLTLVEVLGTVVILGVTFILSASIIFNIFKVTNLQRQKVEMQQVSNGIVTEIERINQMKNLYDEAGYRGKFMDQKDWFQKHIVKVLKSSGEANQWSLLTVTDEGENSIWLTDINDTLNQQAILFKITDPEIKIKIIQQKNENSVSKTLYGMKDYRENYTIQTTAMILFYKESLNFSRYYNQDTGQWNVVSLKKQPNVLYTRLFTSYYKDKAQEKGEVPGDGR